MFLSTIFYGCVLQLPKSDLELNTLYHQLLQPNSGTLQASHSEAFSILADTPPAGRPGSRTGGSRPGSRAGSRAGSRRASLADAAVAAAAAGVGAADNMQPVAAGGFGHRASSSSLSVSIQNSPAAASLYIDLFKWYDRNKSGALEREELQVCV